MQKDETVERINSQYEFMEGIIAADQALITALKQQRAALREVVESLINCADHNRDMVEIRAAKRVLADTTH